MRDIYPGIPRSLTCSLTCSVAPNTPSSLQASSPWLEPGEDAWSRGGRGLSNCFFAEKRLKTDRIGQTPHSASRACRSPSPENHRGSTPTHTPCSLVCFAALRSPAAPLWTIALVSAIVLAAGRVGRRLRRRHASARGHLPDSLSPRAPSEGRLRRPVFFGEYFFRRILLSFDN